MKKQLKSSPIKIDWKGTADYYEEQNRRLALKFKRDRFQEYVSWVVILTGLLFLIDMWAYLHVIH